MLLLAGEWPLNRVSALLPQYSTWRAHCRNLLHRAHCRHLLHGTRSLNEPTSLFLPSQPGKQISTVLAPMVAASDYPFRCLCRQHSDIDLTFTQMWHAKHLVEKPEFLKSHWDVFELESGNSASTTLTKAQRNCFGDSERLLVPPCEKASSGPVVVQLAGHDVDIVTKAALLVVEKSQGKVAGIDLNLGWFVQRCKVFYVLLIGSFKVRKALREREGTELS